MIRNLIILLMLLAAPMAQARVVMLGCEAPQPEQLQHDCCPSKAQAAASADQQGVDDDCCDLSIDFAAQDHLVKLQLDGGSIALAAALRAPIPHAAAALLPPATGPPPAHQARSGRLTFQKTARLRV